MTMAQQPPVESKKSNAKASAWPAAGRRITKKSDFFALVKKAQEQKRAAITGAIEQKGATTKEKIKDTVRKLQGDINIEEETSKWAIIYKKLGVSHWGLLVIIVAYAFMGGAIFQAIEGPQESRNKVNLTGTSDHEVEALLKIIAENGQCSLSTSSQSEIKEAIIKYQIEKGIRPSNRNNWNLWGSMFYASTLFTTIGYGHYSPQTDLGRIVTMIYAFFGIPLMLATLNDLGKLLTRLLKPPWNLIRGAIHRCHHKLKKKKKKRQLAITGEGGEPFVKAKKSESTEEHSLWDYGSETSEEVTEFNFPIPVVLSLFFLWIVICAPIFCIWEKKWTYFTSFYFFFISLTTIGLGDVVPDHPNLMLTLFPLVLFGLSLISMCINLIQEKMDELKDDALDFLEDTLGWDTESSDEEEDEHGNIKPKIRPDKIPSDEWGGPGNPDDQNRRSASREREWTPKAALGIFGGGSATRVGPRAAAPKEGPTPDLMIAKWKSRAVRRKRRGVQTDESFIQSLKQDLRTRFPGGRISDIYPVPSSQRGDWVVRSRDDVSSLVDETDVTLLPSVRSTEDQKFENPTA